MKKLINILFISLLSMPLMARHKPNHVINLGGPLVSTKTIKQNLPTAIMLNLADYGTPADGTAAFNAAIAALPAYGGTIWVPIPSTGQWQCATAITPTSKRLHLIGEGETSYDFAGGSYVVGASTINYTAATGTLFDLSAAGNIFEHINITSTAATPISSLAINLSNAGYVKILHCSISGFYNQINLIQGVAWDIDDLVMLDPVNYALKIENPSNPDNGDFNLHHSLIGLGHSTSTGILYKSSGGAKIDGLKIVSLGSEFLYGIDAAITGNTGQFFFTNGSIEHAHGSAIKFRGNVLFGQINIHDNQFSTPSSGITGGIIDIKGNKFSDIIIHDNIMLGNPAAVSSPAIVIDSASRISVRNNLYDYLLNKHSITNCTTVDTISTIAGNGGTQLGNVQVATLSAAGQMSAKSGALLGNASANYISISGSSAAPLIQAQGSNTNIELMLQAKGFGQILTGPGGWTYTNAATGANSLFLNNGTTDSPNLKFANGNLTNFSIDVASNTLRFIKDADESTGAVIANFAANGNFTSNGTVQGTTLKQTTFSGGKALVSIGTSVVESAISSTELGYLSGVTSAVQTQLNSNLVLSGSYTGTGSSTTTYTVTIGKTQANAMYKVQVTPTNALAAALFYVSNKTTTTFDIIYSTGLSGTITFDWSLYK